MCCAPSVCNGGAQRRSMEGLGGGWDGSRDDEDYNDSRAWIAGREDGTCMCRAPSFSRYSLFVEVPPSPLRKRPRPARCITPVRRAQSSWLPLARTGVGRAPGSSAACHAGLVGTWWWRDAVLRGGAGRGGGKPADRLDRIGSGRVGRLAVGGWRFFGARFFLSLSLWVLEGRRGSVLQGAGAGRMWPCWVWGEAWVALVMGGMGWSGFEGGLWLWSVG